MAEFIILPGLELPRFRGHFRSWFSGYSSFFLPIVEIPFERICKIFCVNCSIGWDWAALLRENWGDSSQIYTKANSSLCFRFSQSGITFSSRL